MYIFVVIFKLIGLKWYILCEIKQLIRKLEWIIINRHKPVFGSISNCISYLCIPVSLHFV